MRENQPDTDQLFPLVYDELKRLARRYLRRERSSHTLQPTALVNEAYIQLSSLKSARWLSRNHFMGVAALAMRRVLTDYVRDRHAAKRGAGQVLIPLDESPAAADPAVWDFDDLDVALSKLETAAAILRDQPEPLPFPVPWSVWSGNASQRTPPRACNRRQTSARPSNRCAKSSAKANSNRAVSAAPAKLPLGHFRGPAPFPLRVALAVATGAGIFPPWSPPIG